MPVAQCSHVVKGDEKASASTSTVCAGLSRLFHRLNVIQLHLGEFEAYAGECRLCNLFFYDLQNADQDRSILTSISEPGTVRPPSP